MPCGSIDDLVNAREGERVLWTGLVKVFEIDVEAPGFVLFGTITRLASQSGCLISLMNPASKSLASSSPISCLLGSENRRRACLTGLNPFRIFRLCSASLRGIPGMSEGCQAKMSQFSRRNSRSAASTSGFNCAQMEAVFWGPLDGPGI